MKGYDSFFEAPGTIESHICHVCGTTCDVERNKYAPTNHIAALAKKSTYHDYFFCPYRGEAWHEKAMELVKAIEETPSSRVAELMKLDLQDLLQKYVPKE